MTGTATMPIVAKQYTSLMAIYGDQKSKLESRGYRAALLA